MPPKDSTTKKSKLVSYPKELAQARFKLFNFFCEAEPDSPPEFRGTDDSLNLQLYKPGQMFDHRNGSFHSHRGAFRRWLSSQSGGVEYNRMSKEYREDHNYDKNGEPSAFESVADYSAETSFFPADRKKLVSLSF